MALLNEKNKKAKIEYPCEWRYKVIGKEKKNIENAVKSILGEKAHSLAFSKCSRNGSYYSYELKTLVHSEEERIDIFRQLKRHTHLDMVL